MMRDLWMSACRPSIGCRLFFFTSCFFFLSFCEKENRSVSSLWPFSGICLEAELLIRRFRHTKLSMLTTAVLWSLYWNQFDQCLHESFEVSPCCCSSPGHRRSGVTVLWGVTSLLLHEICTWLFYAARIQYLFYVSVNLLINKLYYYL